MTDANPAPTDAAAALRAHIARKAEMRELDRQVAVRMIAALDAGAAPEYAALHEAAVFLPLPAVCFHTAPVAVRASILEHGLLPHLPAAGRWGRDAGGQPPGVYVGPVPDSRGVWADDTEWDVWAVDTPAGTRFVHDRLNPGCWILDAIAPSHLRLHGTYSHPTC